MIVVLANGCFDPLHYGHILHLREARKLGDTLIVAITDDESVRKEKGLDRPFYPWHHRAELLRELRCVSAVIASHNALDAIARIRPNVFAKGIDYARCGLPEEVRNACRDVGARIAFTKTEKFSATDFARRVSARAA